MSNELGKRKYNGEDPKDRRDQIKDMTSGEAIGEVSAIWDATRAFERAQDKSKFGDDALIDLTLLDNVSKKMLGITTPQSVTERLLHDRRTTPITAGGEDEEMKVVGYKMPLSKLRHLMVLTDGPTFVTGPERPDLEPEYLQVMNSSVLNTGIPLYGEETLPEGATGEMLQILASESCGVGVVHTGEDPEMYDILQKALGIDTGFERRVAKGYEEVKFQDSLSRVIRGVQGLIDEEFDRAYEKPNPMDGKGEKIFPIQDTND